MAIMFDFLKNLGKTHFSIVDYGQGIIKFRCSKGLQLGQTIEGIADLPNRRHVDLEVQVVQKIPEGYAARVLGPKNSLSEIEQLFLATISGEKEQMYYKLDESDPTHHIRTYSVRSKGLPNFRALTSEISMEDATLVLDGAVKEGAEMTLHMDLDDPQLPPINIEAKVDWCKQRDDKYWVAHLSVLYIKDQEKTMLKQFLANLKNRAPNSASVLDQGR